ncbi:MAG TPA: right-handed parallel beta-helix repeat-containing protein [Chitinivibrionales bacterium]|nr:right-handed parallel beta-helix repeat-containing protein [Chitinivibrionales bacterium]
MKTFISTIVIILSALTSASAKNESFTISRDTVLTGTFEVPESLTCVIKPGTTIKFSGYYKFVVRGLLIARGTAAEPITFTCVNRPHGAVAPPCWCGFLIYGKRAGAYCRNCRFEGMYRGLVWEAGPVFDSCEFAGNHVGLYCTKQAAPHVKDCKFFRNVYGVVADFATPVLVDNVITSNTIGVCLQIGSRPLAGRNTIFGNGTDVRNETALKGDTTAMAIQGLWELMSELY